MRVTRGSAVTSGVCVFLLVLSLQSCVTTTLAQSVTIYRPVANEQVGNFLNLTFKITGGTCVAGSTFVIFYNVNTTRTVKIIDTARSALTYYRPLRLTNLTTAYSSTIVNSTGYALGNGTYKIDVGCVIGNTQYMARVSNVLIKTSCTPLTCPLPSDDVSSVVYIAIGCSVGIVVILLALFINMYRSSKPSSATYSSV